MSKFDFMNDLLPLVGALSTAVLITRSSPVRAVWIALRSRFAFKPVPESLRFAETKLLKTLIADRKFGQGYLVVTGENGVGKTCLLNTATSKTPGVIKVRAQQSDDENTIIENTLQELANPLLNHSFSFAPRVIFWYRLFTLGRTPIVVIKVAARSIGKNYAGITGAVRTLVENYKLRVIVEGSPNSLDERLLRTHRQQVVDIKPMTKDMIWQLGQFQELFKYVEEAGLDDIVFAVLGGIPSDYENLWSHTKFDLQDGQNSRKVIGTYLCAAIFDAIYLVSKINMKEIIKLYDSENMPIIRDTLVNRNLTSDKVFREGMRDGVFVLIPVSNAIGIVLQHGLAKKPSLDELEEMLKKKV